MHGDIMRISRLRMATDGTGVSTLVAFHGCPLRCKFCINDQCHNERTSFPDVSRNYTPEALIKVLKKDDIYFRMTGGGIVFGGGEPLLHAEFIHEVCRLADPAWKKRIETSLFGDWRSFRGLVNDIDEWIIDIKDMNPDIYKKYTQVSNSAVIRNLKMLRKRVHPKQIWIRLPHIPGYNTDKDVARSRDLLYNLGFTRIEEFDYEYSRFVSTKPHEPRMLEIPGLLLKNTGLEEKDE